MFWQSGIYSGGEARAVTLLSESRGQTQASVSKATEHWCVCAWPSHEAYKLQVKTNYFTH